MYAKFQRGIARPYVYRWAMRNAAKEIEKYHIGETSQIAEDENHKVKFVCHCQPGVQINQFCMEPGQKRTWNIVFICRAETTLEWLIEKWKCN